MSTTIRFIDAFKILLASGWITLPDGTIVKPTFGDYLDSIAGETPIFMTIGIDPLTIRAFDSYKNDPITIDNTGLWTIVDTNHQTLSFFTNPLPSPAVTSSYWPTNGDQDEP